MHTFWKKDIVSWEVNGVVHLSIPFTWLIPKAQKIIYESKKKVLVGGPAVDLMPEQFKEKNIGKDVNLPVPPIQLHNPFATFTSKGCVNKCAFCAVPRIEGRFRELKDWPVRPLVCDNNFLASSKRHFNDAIDKLKQLPYVDFNQGLDCRLLKDHHVSRLQELQKPTIRFAFDSLTVEDKFVDAINRVKAAGFKDIKVYVLINFIGDTPETAMYRLNKCLEMGVWTYAMRYQPLDALERNSFLAEGWDEKLITRILPFFNRHMLFKNMPFEKFKRPIEAGFGLVPTGEYFGEYSPKGDGKL
jgi:hypothetical protein